MVDPYFELAGCDDGSTNDEPPPDNEIIVPSTGVQVYNGNGTSYTGSNTVKGKIYNVTPEVFLDVGTITDGKLTLALPEIVQDAWLDIYEGSSAIIEPSDLRVYYKGFGRVFNGSNETGYLSFTNDADTQEHNAYYIYFNKDATITGTHVSSSNPGNSTEYTITGKKGWNLVYEHDVDSGKSVVTTNSSSMPNNMKWFFTPKRE
ncbi:hypothetical protein AGMMS50267_10130 [Spirochaetia bacterium]|nr:hypothetical protein AGMMS50267_10130 [Spirochaetia bacterium]